MIEGISAVTLGTHEMPRAVRFYCALGFEVLRGNEQSSFTSFRAGMSHLNLVFQPAERRWALVGSRDLLRRRCRCCLRTCARGGVPTNYRAPRRRMGRAFLPLD